MTIYQVIGTRDYAGYTPGEKFEATLEPRAEARAIKRGNIVIVKKSTPRVKKSNLRMPKDG